MEHFINVKKKPLYVCFVDFKKAFDKVSHLILWKKLISYGVGGRFLDTIRSMYSIVKSCVTSNNGLRKLFSYTRGLRQGCLLSPILFAMFLNDLNEFILEMASGVRIWDEQICAMLYADDLILVAESENDLRIQMNQLGIYSNLVRMEVSQKKTKVVVFSKTRKGTPKTIKGGTLVKLKLMRLKVISI